MKKNIFQKLLILGAVLFFAHSADAFDFNKIVTTAPDSPTVETKVADLGTANKKAVKDFKQRVGNTTANWWVTDQNGFYSYFKEDGYTSHIGYDKKGNWVYSMIYYNESKLPKDVRASVKSVYYDMSIVLVEEIQTVNGKVYVVSLEDKNNIRVIKVNDEGEMETVQEISK